MSVVSQLDSASLTHVFGQKAGVMACAPEHLRRNPIFLRSFFSRTFLSSPHLSRSLGHPLPLAILLRIPLFSILVLCVPLLLRPLSLGDIRSAISGLTIWVFQGCLFSRVSLAIPRSAFDFGPPLARGHVFAVLFRSAFLRCLCCLPFLSVFIFGGITTIVVLAVNS